MLKKPAFDKGDTVRYKAGKRGFNFGLHNGKLLTVSKLTKPLRDGDAAITRRGTAEPMRRGEWGGWLVWPTETNMGFPAAWFEQVASSVGARKISTRAIREDSFSIGSGKRWACSSAGERRSTILKIERMKKMAARKGRAAKKKAPGKRARTPRLPGTEDAAIADIEKAAEDYEDTRDERMALTELEVEKKATLLKAMDKHKKTEYIFNDHKVEVVEEPGVRTVKVKKIGSKKKEEDEE